MFKRNDTHIQGDFFSPENRLPEKFKRKLNNHWTKLFYSKVFTRINENDFAKIYEDGKGRPNFPINILVALDIIKDLHDYTDDKLYEDFFLNTGIHKALGIEDIRNYYFSIRTWYNFRSRLAYYENETGDDLLGNIFTTTRDEMIQELNLKTDMQRRDSVFIAANIKRMNRLMLFHKVLSNLVRVLKNFDYEVPEEIAKLVKRDEDSIAYHIKKDKVHETTKEIGNYILELIETYKGSTKIQGSKAYRQAERLLSEQCNIEEKKSYKKVKIKSAEEISSGSMQNPADEDATYRKKNGKEFVGYLCNAAESCNSENPIQIITDIETTKNNIDDSVTGASTLPRIKNETDVMIMIQDGGYHSAKGVETAEELGVELHQTAIRGKAPKIDMLNSSDFVFSENGLIESCPIGKHPIKQTLKDNKVTASFDRRECAKCLMKRKCIVYNQPSHCKIKVDANRKFLDSRINNLNAERTKQLNKLRPPVEGLMEKLKPKHLDGRSVFRGLKKVKNRMIRRAIGLNFNRYVALKNKKLKNSMLFKKFIEYFGNFWEIFAMLEPRFT